MLGYKRVEMMKYVKPGSLGAERVNGRLHEPSLVDHFYEFLVHRGVEVPGAIRHRWTSPSTWPRREQT